ncbi:MAG: efflux RND transporter periplasmic adaptor subunit [bacterium]
MTVRERTRSIGWMLGILIVVAALVAAGVSAKKAAKPKRSAAVVPTATVDRQEISVSVEANGVVEPVSIVDVKSKASGQIVRMPVEIGSLVGAGDLLVQIDTRDVQNQYDQASAVLDAAKARVDVSAAKRKRADDLFAAQAITVEEHEAAILEYANGQSAFVTARTDLDLARQRLEDATVRAPIAGTVIEKPVTVGQVISSATSSVSGGTTLLMMADLKKIRMRALVNEIDIGNVKPGQVAAVAVDAYANREFAGVVEKVEPRAVVEQSVTMFPVLISLSNDEGLLMPGMNGEVTLVVERQENVLSVPMDAVRGMSELPAAAAALGLNADSLRVAMRGGTAERGERGGQGEPRGNGQARLVFVKTQGGFDARIVRLGITNFDDAQVVSGLEEGEEVALLSAAELQRSRVETVERMRQRMGGAMPGMQRQSTGATGSRPGG